MKSIADCNLCSKTNVETVVCCITAPDNEPNEAVANVRPIVLCTDCADKVVFYNPLKNPFVYSLA